MVTPFYAFILLGLGKFFKEFWQLATLQLNDKTDIIFREGQRP
jgi:hypothetical protein